MIYYYTIYTIHTYNMIQKPCHLLHLSVFIYKFTKFVPTSPDISMPKKNI